MKNRIPIRTTIQVPILLAACALLWQAPRAGQAAAAPSGTGQSAGMAKTPATAQIQAADTERVVLMRPSAALEIQAEPSKVWKKLVSSDGMAAFQVETVPRGKTLEKVGDHAQANLAGDRGNVVVTHSQPDKQWRAAFEPDKGHYICSLRFDLKPQGKGTMLTYGDWYSDEKPAQAEATLKQTKQAMTESLARFKGMVEKTSAGP